jgi:drug/metabolite transporter (DMT)-like permease
MALASARIETADARRRGQVYALAAALAWSTGGILQRQVSAGAADQIVGRAVFTLLGLLVFLALRERAALGVSFRSVATPAGLAVAAGIAVAAGTFILALNYTTIAHVLVIQAVTPILAGALALLWIREPLSGRALAAMALAVLGIAVMVGAPHGGDALGELMAFLSPLSFAFVIVIARGHRHVSMAPATAVSQVLLIVCGLPLVHLGQLHGADIGWLALLGLGQQGLGLVLFTMGARLIPAASMGLILILESVLGSVWGWLGTSERPDATTLVGGVVVLCAVVIKLRDDAAREDARA